MARTSNIYIRVEPEVKTEAESILKELGIPMSNAVAMFLRQIILQKGIPFDMKLPNKEPLIYKSLTKEDFDEAINKGIKDFENGNIHTSEELKEHLNRKYGI